MLAALFFQALHAAELSVGDADEVFVQLFDDHEEPSLVAPGLGTNDAANLNGKHLHFRASDTLAPGKESTSGSPSVMRIVCS